MLFPQEDAEAVKQWLITELEPLYVWCTNSRSDADPDVLADYVLALFKYDTSEQELLLMMNEQLVDFLEGETEPFVNKAYNALKSGAYRTGPAPDTRKREADDQDIVLEDADVSTKRQAYAFGDGSAPEPMPENPEGMPMPARGARAVVPKGWCRDYHNLGYCARGDKCKFRHSDDMIVGAVPDQNFPMLPPPDVPWEPEQVAMAMEQMQQMVASGQLPEGLPMPPPPMFSGRGMRGGRGRGRGGRAGYMSQAPPAPRSQDTLVIENIPSEHLELAHVNDYFKRFGTITNIDVEPHESKAVVTYASPAEAEAAHKDPSVIFGNRFVKVYYQRLEPKPRAMKPMPSKPNYMTDKGSNVYIAPELRPAAAAPPAPSPIDVERRKLLALRKKKQSLLSMQIAEQKSLVEKLGNKELTPQGRQSIMAMLDKLSTEIKSATEALKKDIQPANAMETDGDSGPTTEELQGKLASLRQEAAALGLDTSGHARGGHRGGARGAPSYRGRGSFNRSFTLDNRTTRIGISALPATYDADKVKSYLERFGALQSLEQDAGRWVAQYETRASGEKAMRSGTTIPDVGPVHLEWVDAPPAATPHPDALAQAHLDADAERENWKR